MILHLTNEYYTHKEKNDEMLPCCRVMHKNKQFKTTKETTKKKPVSEQGPRPKTELMTSRGRLSSSPTLAYFKHLQHFIHLD